MTWASFSYGTRAWSAAAAPRISSGAALRSLSTARVADQTVFLELTVREISGQVVERPSGRSVYGGAPWAARTYSSGPLSFVQRTPRTFLFSTRPWIGAPGDALRPNKLAAPRIISAGFVSRSIPVDVFARRRGQRTIGDVTLANPDGVLDELVTRYAVEGARIRVWLARPDDASQDWVLLYEAVVDSIEATLKELRLGITTIAEELERPLQLRRYTGTGGIAGDVNVVGRRKPIALGEFWGAAPVLIDASANLYAISDGPVLSIDWVREGGLDYVNDGDSPTASALLAATVAPGHYRTCLQEGVFRVGLNLAGLVYPLRVGGRGDAGGSGYASSTGTILYRLARDRAFLGTQQLDVQSFNALPRGQVGYYYDGSDERSVADVFDALLRGILGWVGVGRGQVLQVGRIRPPEQQASALTLRAEQVLSQRVEQRPDSVRIVQPYRYAPTADPVRAEEVAPGADPDVARRLVEGGLSGVVTSVSDLSVSLIEPETLETYFQTEGAAREAALAALTLSNRSRTPLRLDLGLRGLAVEIGGVVGVEGLRFGFSGGTYRGVIYEQEDRIGARVSSEVTCLG